MKRALRRLFIDPGAPRSLRPRVAAYVCYVVVVVIGAKVARALELCIDGDNLDPLAVLPIALGHDLLAVASVGLLATAVTYVFRGPIGSALDALLLIACGGFMATSLMSYRVTGSGITWQRLRGDEGATLGDLELLSRSDLVTGVGLLAGAVLLVPLMVLLTRRWRVLLIFADLRVLAGVAVTALLLVGAGSGGSHYRYGLDDSPLFLLVETALLAKSERVPLRAEDELTREQWQALMTPSSPVTAKPLPSIADAPIKNVVIFLGEGIPYRYTSFGSAGLDTTPNLRRRMENEGLLFERFYSHYHSSIQSIFSLVCSAYPPMYVSEGNIIAQHPRIDCGELSEHLREAGHSVGLFHGGRFAYYDKLALLGQRGYDVTLDAESLEKRYPRHRAGTWGIDDRAVVKATLDWIDSLEEGVSFGAFLVPITAHYPYSLPRGVEPKFPGEGRSQRFASAVHYLDGVFEQLIVGLEERGIYDDTLVIYLADHGEKVDPLRHRWQAFRSFYQQNLHVPLVLLNPRLFPREMAPRTSDRPGGIIDVLPTALDALSLPADPRHFGQSLLSATWEPRRVFFGSFSSGRTFVGLLEGERKFALEMRSREPALHDLGSDPDEVQHLAVGKRQVVDDLTTATLSFYRANQMYFAKAPSLPQSRALHEQILDSATVRLLDGAGQPTPCSKQGLAWTCPDAEGEPALREAVWAVDSENSRCLEVRVPDPSLSLELRLEGDVLRLISGARVGVPNRLRRNGELRIEVGVDGDLVGVAEIQRRRDPMEWFQFRMPERELRVLVSRASLEAPDRACLLFSDEAWRAVNRPGVPDASSSTPSRP